MESKIINRGELVVDKTFEKGFGVTALVDRHTCGSDHLVMGHTVHNPASRNQAHVHMNCEVMWFTMAGHSRHWNATREHENYAEVECFRGTVGYVAANELHCGMNLNSDETGEVLFFYSGVNDKDEAGTEFVEDVSVVEEYMRARGKELSDVL